MMLQKKISEWARLRLLVAVPLVAAMLLASAQPGVEKKAADILQQDNPESVVKQVQTDPLFYWNQVRNYLGDNKRPDVQISKNNHNVVIVLINSKNQIMFKTFQNTDWFKTEKEGKSDAAINLLKKMIIEEMSANKNRPIYISLQNDAATSNEFLVNFLKNTLPRAYENALSDFLRQNNVDLIALKQKQPLLFLYSNPMTFSDKTNKKPETREQKNNSFSIRTSVQKNGTEEMSRYTVVPYANADLRTLSLKLETISENEEKTTVQFGKPIDVSVISVGSELTKTDIESLEKVLDDKLPAKETYFVYSLNF